MRELLRITSVHNARVDKVLRLRKHRERRTTGLFIAEGLREVSRAVQANLKLRQLFVCSALLAQNNKEWSASHILSGIDRCVERFEVTEAVLTKMAYRKNPEGMLAVVEQPIWTLEDMPPVTSQTLYLVVVEMTKPGNLGAIVRTAGAAGCQAVIAAATSVDIFNPNAIRNSTGAVFSVPTISAAESQTLDYLRAHGVRIIAATPARDRAVTHTQADLRGPLAIMIGPEDTGLSTEWFKAAELSEGQRVTIPMRGRTVDSLNASAAAAVLLFEARRQLDG